MLHNFTFLVLRKSTNNAINDCCFLLEDLTESHKKFSGSFQDSRYGKYINDVFYNKIARSEQIFSFTAKVRMSVSQNN